MGFDDFQERKYCGIRNGKIVHKDDSGITYEKQSVSGVLTDVFVKRDGKFGPEFHVVLYDNGLYHLQMFLNSSYARAFMCMMKNISPAQPLTIKPSEHIGENGKKRQSLFLYQEGEPVKWFYKKDMNGLPAPELDILTDRDGQPYEGWSYEKQTEFLLNALDQFKPLLIPNKVRQRNENIINREKAAPAAAPWKSGDDNNGDIADDLPF